MTAFSAMIDTLFADANIAQDATWSGITDPVRVIKKRAPVEADGLTGGVRIAPSGQAAAILVDVRVSEVAAPAAGQTVTVSGKTYPVLDADLDDEGLVWTVRLGKPS